MSGEKLGDEDMAETMSNLAAFADLTLNGALQPSDPSKAFVIISAPIGQKLDRPPGVNWITNLKTAEVPPLLRGLADFLELQASTPKGTA